METRYQGEWDCNIMADYCWSIQRDSSAYPHIRKWYKRKFFGGE